MPRFRSLLVGALAAALLVPAAVAHAGTYTVYMCAGPNGAPLPAAGVVPSTSTTNASVTNTCGAPGGVLQAALVGSNAWSVPDGAVIKFPVPAGTAITGVSLARATQGLQSSIPTTGHGNLTYSLKTDTDTLEACPTFGSPPPCSDFTGTFARTGLQSSFIQLDISCAGEAGDTCPAPATGAPNPHVNVTQAVFNVADNTAPALSNVRGALFANGPAKGITTVQFNATDVGGGLYRAFTLVDGKVVTTQPLDQHCTDVDPSDADPYQFSSLSPCLTSLTDFTVPIDTTKLEEGVHTFAVQIEDAAGNNATVAGPKAIRVENLNGINASPQATLKMWFVKTRKRVARSVRGERVVVRGTLTGAHHKGISGAIVDVYHYVGKHRLSKTGLKSRRGGRLTLILPRNLFGDKKGHRRLVFVYRVRRPGAATSTQRLLLSIHYPSGKPLYRPAR